MEPHPTGRDIRATSCKVGDCVCVGGVVGRGEGCVGLDGVVVVVGVRGVWGVGLIGSTPFPQHHTPRPVDQSF